MKTVLVALGVVLGMGSTGTGWGAPFQNLGFDDGDLSAIGDMQMRFGWGPAEALLPAWEVRVDGQPFDSELAWNVVTASGLPTGIFDGGPIDAGQQPGPPVDGAFAFIIAPYDRLFDGYLPWSISQSGDLGSDIRTLRFLSFGQAMEVWIDGEPVETFSRPPTDRSAHRIYQPFREVFADVSSYAGRTVELTFRAIEPEGDVRFNGLDRIEFLETPMPPQVLETPKPQVILLQEDAVFWVDVQADGPAFQWFKDGVPLREEGRFTGTDSELLLISGARLEDAGRYAVSVTNEAGEVFLDTALLEVATRRPWLSLMTSGNGERVEIAIHAEPELVHVLERTTDLRRWQVWAILRPRGELCLFSDRQWDPSAFYRVRLVSQESDLVTRFFYKRC